MDILDNADEIERRFVYHAPNDETRALHEIVRAKTFEYASEVIALLPASRERSLAVTALEEFSFWCHAAIARNL